MGNVVFSFGPLAHLVEHLICNEGVAGSSPVRSTVDDLRGRNASFVLKTLANSLVPNILFSNVKPKGNWNHCNLICTPTFASDHILLGFFKYSSINSIICS